MTDVTAMPSALKGIADSFGTGALAFTSKGLGAYTGILKSAYKAKAAAVTDPESGETFIAYKFHRFIQSGIPKIADPNEQKEKIALDMVQRVRVSLDKAAFIPELYVFLNEDDCDLVGKDGELTGHFFLLNKTTHANVPDRLISDQEIKFLKLRVNERKNCLKIPRGAEANLCFAKLDL